MSNLNQFFGGSLWASPMIHVQDQKTGDVDAGYMDTASTYYTRDINRIRYNSLGASLVNDGTTSAVVGAVGTQGIVNNPSSGVHNASSHVILTAGTYVFQLEQSPCGGINLEAHVLYDKTGGVELCQSVGYATGGSLISNTYEGIFEITATSNVEIRSFASIVSTPDTANMGTGATFTSSVNIVHTDLKLFKVA